MSGDSAFEGTGQKLSSLLAGCLFFFGTYPKLRFVITSNLSKCTLKL